MSMQVSQTALQQDVGVIGDDRVDACRRVTGENDAGQQERDDVLSPEQRVLDLFS